MDSGTHEHMTYERVLFRKFTPLSNRSVIVGDGRSLQVLANKEGNLFILNFIMAFNSLAVVCSLGDLCHQNLVYVRSVLNINNIKFLGSSEACVARLKGKIKILPFSESKQSTNVPLQLVKSVGGSRDYATER
ncbi:hypothetical protein PR048_026539 [Dryococelus australis]|uniref:Retrovirus-related Pol polyprotein from transposon TNT 1-94-like beta-barrel domain-containing protein n=1 Tax=Dryococelus australis TaxID=614101 RepID=A0ABQ9GLM6_9NEOP|nr:hypothetical protein PR048_026539 [Dryococelus australis]